MDKRLLLKSVEQLSTGNSTEKKEAKKFLLHSSKELPYKLLVKLCSLLEREDCKKDAEEILVSFADYVRYNSLNKNYRGVEVVLIRLLANKNCSYSVRRIFDVYLGLTSDVGPNGERYFKKELGIAAEEELVYLMREPGCPEAVEKFFWGYVGLDILSKIRNLSTSALFILINGLENKSCQKRERAAAILDGYLKHCWIDRSRFNLNIIIERRHCFRASHEMYLIHLLKKEECQEVVKKVLLKYFKSWTMDLSTYAEEGLIWLLWKKKYRELAEEILLKYVERHRLSEKARKLLKRILFLASIFKNEACSRDLNSFAIKLSIA